MNLLIKNTQEIVDYVYKYLENIYDYIPHQYIPFLTIFFFFVVVLWVVKKIYLTVKTSHLYKKFVESLKTNNVDLYNKAKLFKNKINFFKYYLNFPLKILKYCFNLPIVFLKFQRNWLFKFVFVPVAWSTTYPIQIILSPIVIFCCILARLVKLTRNKDHDKPRLVWGPYPNLSCVEISKALRNKGFTCDTVVYYNFGRIWSSSDFDFCLTDIISNFPYYVGIYLKISLLHFLCFIYVVYNYEIVHGFFYAGYLRQTILEKFEVQLLHLAGCKQINTTIGGDVAHMNRIESHVIRQGIIDMYPDSAKENEQKTIEKWINYYSKFSDYIICQCSYMIDSLPRWDLLVTQYFPIDTENWNSSGYFSDADGRNKPVKIGHSPNHRPLKGTNFLIKAVNELRQEGLKIELVLLENNQNSEVRKIFSQVDIIVADLVLQGYAVMATEGLSLGKPVVQDISDSHYNRVFKLYTGLDEAPFISTPIENIKENLKALIENPKLRHEVGIKSRSYALKYHSYEANSKFWEWVYDYVWYSKRPRIAFYHPDWPIDTISSIYSVVLDSSETSFKKETEKNLEYTRKYYSNNKIAFFPINESTLPLVQKMLRTGVIRSSDYLVSDGNREFANQLLKFPQAFIGIQELADYDVNMLCLLAISQDIENFLVGSEQIKSFFSINDLLMTKYADGNEKISRFYRRLLLQYTSSVVQPLHFSNYAYINYLKTLITSCSSKILDICTGPGTIGLSLAKECNLNEVTLIDINPLSIDSVKENVALNFDSSFTAHIYESDVFDSLPEFLSYDLIVGNPPHNLDIQATNKHLPKNLYVQAHDPNLLFHKKFFDQAKSRLNKGGKICLLENGDEGCITIDHIYELLKDFSEYTFESHKVMPASQFYVVTISLVH
jgi:hypothetical protein